MEPELITILEGPTPDFRRDIQLWNWGIAQTSETTDILWCELRTANGERIRQRCRQAWREGRKVQLDFPDELRLRKQADVVALRLTEMDEGTVLNLWIHQPFDEKRAFQTGDDELDDGNDVDSL